MPEDPKFSAYVEARKALEAKGISEEDYIELFDLLETVTGTDLDAIRDNQFHDDAFDLAANIQSATDKKIRYVGAFLRRFAEHVVRHACSIEESEKIAEIVDRLPQMVKLNKEDYVIPE